MKNEDKIQFKKLYKWKMFLKYGLKDVKQFDEKFIENVLALQKEFYEIKIKKLENELESLNKLLKRHRFSELQKNIKNFLKNYLKMSYIEDIDIFVIIIHIQTINQK